MDRCLRIRSKILPWYQNELRKFYVQFILVRTDLPRILNLSFLLQLRYKILLMKSHHQYEFQIALDPIYLPKGMETSGWAKCYCLNEFRLQSVIQLQHLQE